MADGRVAAAKLGCSGGILTAGFFSSIASAIRDRRYSYLLLTLSLASTLCAQAPTAPASQEKNPPAASRIDPKAQEVLNKAIQSLGGEAFLQAKSVYMRGRTYAISEDSASGVVPFESTVEFPDKRRFSYGKDKPITLINDGEHGWQIDRYGMVRQPLEQVRRWKNGARYGYENLLRRVIREDGVLVQDAGRDFTDNLAARVVTITDAQQVQIRVYLSTVNSLPIRVTYRVQNPETHDWEEFGEMYSDYRDFQGIQTPRHVTRSLDGDRYSEVFRNVVEYNREIPANYFTPGS